MNRCYYFISSSEIFDFPDTTTVNFLAGLLTLPPQDTGVGKVVRAGEELTCFAAHCQEPGAAWRGVLYLCALHTPLQAEGHTSDGKQVPK